MQQDANIQGRAQPYIFLSAFLIPQWKNSAKILYTCFFTHGLPPFSLCPLQKRRDHSWNVEFQCSNAQLTMQDSFQWMGWPQGRSARWAMTAGAVAVKTEVDIKASNMQAKKIKPVHLQVPGPTTLRQARKVWSKISRNFMSQAVLLHSSSFSDYKNCPETKVPFLPGKFAAAKAGVWLPLLGPHGQST